VYLPGHKKSEREEIYTYEWGILISVNPIHKCKSLLSGSDIFLKYIYIPLTYSHKKAREKRFTLINIQRF